MIRKIILIEIVMIIGTIIIFGQNNISPFKNYSMIKPDGYLGDQNVGDTRIEYFNLSSDEIEVMRGIINLTNREFLTGLSRITFAKKDIGLTDGVSRAGFYWIREKGIDIRIFDERKPNESINSYMAVLCHELLHHQGLNHGIAMDRLKRSNICYGETW